MTSPHRTSQTAPWFLHSLTSSNLRSKYPCPRSTCQLSRRLLRHLPFTRLPSVLKLRVQLAFSVHGAEFRSHTIHLRHSIKSCHGHSLYQQQSLCLCWDQSQRAKLWTTCFREATFILSTFWRTTCSGARCTRGVVGKILNSWHTSVPSSNQDRALREPTLAGLKRCEYMGSHFGQEVRCSSGGVLGNVPVWAASCLSFFSP